MGFRSTFTIEYTDIIWSDWFVEKYKDCLWFNSNHRGVIHPNSEYKTYGKFSELHTDIQKVLIEYATTDNDCYTNDIVLVYLHECGGITRCHIFKDKINWSEPSDWVKTDGVEHNYCNGCSDFAKAK